MPGERFEIRISLLRLLVGLLVTILPISIAGLFAIGQSDRSLETTIGSYFRTMAESTAASVSQFIHDRVIDVSAIALEPAVIEVVAAANRSYRGLSEAAVGERIQKIDKSWTTPAADAMVNQILATPASRLLRRRREHDRRLLRITVTDEKGATVAATHKTLDYYQADEEYWQNIYAQGRGAVSLTDILYDEVTQSYYIGVGVPVLEEGSSRFIGTLDALVEVSSLFPIVNRLHMGASARTLLVKDDGTVISSPQANLAMNLKSAEHAAVRDAAQDMVGRETGFLVADVSGGNRSLIAFADTGLLQDYRNLGWMVVVAQDVSQAFAPIRTAGRLIAFMSLLGLGGAVVVAVYFTLHRRRPLAEIEELAHPGAAAPSSAA